MRLTTRELSLGYEYGSYQDFAARMGLDQKRCALAHAWDCGRIVVAGKSAHVYWLAKAPKRKGGLKA